MSDNKLRVVLQAIGAEKFAKQIGKANNQLQAFGNDAKDVGQKLSLGLSVPIALAGVKALSSAAKFEKLQTQLNVLTGSAEKGTKAFKQLVEFSAGTPFQLDELVKANNTLMGFGVSTEDAFKHLQSIGDIAAVSGGDLQGISVAFGQVAAAGRLMGQDLLQLINNGVPIIDMLSDSMGVAKSEIKNMVSEGKVTFPVLIKAFEQATSEGGKFAGGMAMLSGTLGGVFSTLKDNINIAFAEVGKSIVESFDLIEVTKGIIESIQNATNAFKNFSPTTKKAIIVITGLVAALGPVLLALGTLITLLPTIGAAFAVLTGPVGLTIMAITAIGAAIVIFQDEIKEMITFLKVKLANAFVETIGFFKKIAARIKGVGKIIGKALKLEFSAIPKILDETDAEIENINKETGEKIADNITEGYKEQIEKNKKDLQAATANVVNSLNVPTMGGGETRKPVAAVGGGLGAKAGTSMGTTQQLNLDAGSSLLGEMQTVDTDPIAMLAASVSNSNADLESALVTANGILNQKANEAKLMAIEFNEQMTPIVQGGLQQMAMGLGSALGEAITNGGNLAGALASTLLGTLGDMAIQLGSLAISMGITLKGIVTALKSLNPVVAIAAGIALIALGTVVKSAAGNIGKGKKGGGGGATSSGPRSGAIAAFANGGIVSGPTLGLMGEYAGAKSNPEVIAPLDKLKNIIGDRQAQQVNVGGEFRLNGQDLVVALQRAEKQRGRIK